MNRYSVLQDPIEVATFIRREEAVRFARDSSLQSGLTYRVVDNGGKFSPIIFMNVDGNTICIDSNTMESRALNE